MDPICATGGGDGPEDVMGALKVTFSKLNWRSSSAKVHTISYSKSFHFFHFWQVLIHIADAPCHGTQYNEGGDSYQNGDPAGITHDEMMREVVRLDIQYWFGYINRDYTDKMIQVFNDSLKELSKHSLLIRQFEAVQPDQIGEAVHKSVTASVMAVEAKKASSMAICTLDSSVTNWSVLAEKSGIKTPPPGPKSLNALQEGLKLEKPSIPLRIKIAQNPFNDGKESVVYKGYDARNNRHLVLKQFKARGNTLDSYMKVLEIRTIASTYATEFNQDKRKPSHLDAVELISVDIADISGDLYVLQPFTDGKFEKYNTNHGIVCMTSPQSDMMQAFSHFTYVRSGESLLICDLEGVRNYKGIQLIDPAIHYRFQPMKFGDTDSGFVGIKRFFKSHSCNDICRSMGLETIRA